jgi:hypothetical protein
MRFAGAANRGAGPSIRCAQLLVKLGKMSLFVWPETIETLWLLGSAVLSRFLARIIITGGYLALPSAVYLCYFIYA